MKSGARGYDGVTCRLILNIIKTPLANLKIKQNFTTTTLQTLLKKIIF